MNGHVLITGASRGIGRQTAAVFAEAGCTLTLCCRTRTDLLLAQADSLRETFGTRVKCIRADVSDPAQAASLAAEAQAAFGPVDLLINNAGISYVGLLTEMTDEDWTRIIRTNLSSVFYLSRAVLPEMIRRRDGVILNVSSVFGERGASCEAAYAASKGGVNALTRSLGKELAPSNVRVNAVAFGVIDTEMNDNLSSEEKTALAEEIPAGRFASAREAGEFLLQVASSPAYLTGQVISFGGGWDG